MLEIIPYYSNLILYFFTLIIYIITFSLLFMVSPTNPKYLRPQNCWPDIPSDVEVFSSFMDFLQHFLAEVLYSQSLQLDNAWQLSWQSFAESTIANFLPSSVVISFIDPLS